jgi:outer membrane protein assembly factor BamB
MLNTFVAVLIASIGAVAGSLDDKPAVLTATGGLTHNCVFATRPLTKLTGIKWQYDVVSKASGTVLPAGDIILVGNKDGALFAVDQSSGQPVWKFQGQGKIYNAPVVLDSVAYLATGGGWVYALKLSSGQLIWKDSTGGGICQAPAIYDGVLYAGDHNKVLSLIDINTGKGLGKITEVYDLCATPAVYKGTLFYPDWGSNLHALDPKKLNKKWSLTQNKPGNWFTAPSIAVDIAYFVCFDSTLRAVNIDSGNVRWTFEADGRLSRAPAIDRDRLFLTTEDSHIYALKTGTGAVVWDLKKSGTVYSYAVVAGDVVFFGSGDGFVYALNRDDGRELWRVEVGGSPGTPAVRNEIVYVTSGNILYALE